MRLNDNNTFIGINPPYQLSVIHSSKLIYPREIYQRGVERNKDLAPGGLGAAQRNKHLKGEPEPQRRHCMIHRTKGDVL